MVTDDGRGVGWLCKAHREGYRPSIGSGGLGSLIDALALYDAPSAYTARSAPLRAAFPISPHDTDTAAPQTTSRVPAHRWTLRINRCARVWQPYRTVLSRQRAKPSLHGSSRGSSRDSSRGWGQRVHLRINPGQFADTQAINVEWAAGDLGTHGLPDRASQMQRGRRFTVVVVEVVVVFIDIVVILNGRSVRSRRRRRYPRHSSMLPW